jgi:hypothetical protein
MLLRALDKAGFVGQFKIGEEEVGARPKGGFNEVRVTAGGAFLTSGEANYEYVERTLAIVLRTIEPGPLSHLHSYHQFVVPVLGSYETLRKDTAVRLFGNFAKKAGTTDWALLMDMPRGDGVDQVEFGIVESGEINDRIARRVGRMLTGSSLEVPAGALPRRVLPDVALFADYNWGATKLPQDGGERWVLDQLGAARRGSETFVDGLAQALSLSADGNLTGEAKA